MHVCTKPQEAENIHDNSMQRCHVDLRQKQKPRSDKTKLLPKSLTYVIYACTSAICLNCHAEYPIENTEPITAPNRAKKQELLFDEGIHLVRILK